jgi:hypothetical protein
VLKHVGAALVINILTKPSAQCWFFMHSITNTLTLKICVLSRKLITRLMPLSSEHPQGTLVRQRDPELYVENSL